MFAYDIYLPEEGKEKASFGQERLCRAVAYREILAQVGGNFAIFGEFRVDMIGKINVVKLNFQESRERERVITSQRYAKCKDFERYEVECALWL